MTIRNINGSRAFEKDFIPLGNGFVFSPEFKERILDMVSVHSDLLNGHEKYLFENEARHL